MKVSLNWAQKYSNVDLKSIPKDELLKKIGAQLGAIDEVIEWGLRYDGIVIARVITCDKHPNADKLSVCSIDDGGITPDVNRDEHGYIKVVCGAPNIRVGLLVPWISPGVTVPSTLDKEPFVLETREIRGVVSNGMLASAHELGISEDHSGILEIKAEDTDEKLAKPGTPFKKLYGLDDTVIDIENKMFTHRPDLFGALGVARELAGIQQKAFRSPDWYLQEPTFEVSQDLPLDVRVEEPDIVPRFMATALKGISVKPSPVWLQAGLTRIGIRSINNIVDITNFVMYVTGQPLHAYDYDKVKAKSGSVPTLIARKARKDEAVMLLNGKKMRFNDPVVLIATDKEAIGVGGVMGGADTEVDHATTNIILEVATFDMYNVRKTAMRYGLFTDAVTRFTKGQSRLQNDRVLGYAIKNVFEVAGGQLAGKVYDIQQTRDNQQSQQPVSVTAEFVNKRLGTKLSLKEMATLLENVEFRIMSVPADKTGLHVVPPFWRTDIEIPEDVVEEIGRLYGYDHLPLELPKRLIKPTSIEPLIETKQTLRAVLSRCGANETLTYSFVHGDLLDKVGQDKNNAFQLSNALSPDLQYYRMSLIPSLLEKIHPNIKAGYGAFALFEINPVHAKDYVDKEGLPIEDHRTALVFAADDKTTAAKYGGAAYYEARKYLMTLLDALRIDTPIFEPATARKPEAGISQAAIAPFERTRAAIVKTKDGGFIGEIGEFRSVVRRNLKLPVYVAGFELDTKQLMKLQNQYSPYISLSRFPKVEQDISLRVPGQVVFAELAAFMADEVVTLAPPDAQSVLTALDIYQREGDNDRKQITFRLTITSYDRTLTTEEINALLDRAAAAAHKKFGAERI